MLLPDTFQVHRAEGSFAFLDCLYFQKLQSSDWQQYPAPTSHIQHDAGPLYNPSPDTPVPQVTAPGPGTPHNMQFYAKALTE